MPTIVQLRLTPPHPAQAKIIKESKRFNVVCCGRRFGKTKLGQDRLIHPAIQGKPTGWFSPTYRSLSDAWRSLTTTLHPITTRRSDSEHRLELRGGGVIEAWSLDNPDSGRGRAYAAVVIDEAALVVDLEHAWQESIRPMLPDFRGDAWFLSMPKGTANYFHALYQKGRGILKGEWRSWQMPTSANPFIDPQEIELAREDMSDLAFSQEYMAQFVTWQGSVFSRLREAITDPNSMTGKPAVIGVDWAGSSGSGDYTAFITLSTTGHVLDITRLRGEPFVQQRSRLQGIWQRFGRPPILAEENGMGAVQNAECRQQGMSVEDWTTTNASKTMIISKLVQAFEQGNIHIPNDEVLLGELQAFQCTPLAGGQFRYSAPPGLHDDLVMALAIAYTGLGDAVRRQADSMFFRQCFQANASLTKSGFSGDGGDMERLPHEYPEGGSAMSTMWNETRRQRWGM
jgi:hypothetical protein